MRKKKILELFAGSRSFSKVAEEAGHITFTSDIKPLENIDYVVNILNFEVEKVPITPDILWASPNCSAWSKAGGNRYFNSKSLFPKIPAAEVAFTEIDAMFSVIEYFLRKNPKMLYYVENPEGRLQKYLQAGTLFSNIPRLVVLDQCQYGREYQKTTHIFTNNFRWQPRSRCPGRPICHHRENLKDSWSGAKAGKNLTMYYKRAMIPAELCTEILENS